MRIGIVCEGSYPYVSGGVSSWVHSIIKGMPEHEFIILAIVPASQKRILQYSLPDNVIQIIEIPVFYEEQGSQKRVNKHMSSEDFDELLSFFQMKTNSGTALRILHSLSKSKDPNIFFRSKAFFEIAKQCSEEEDNVNFIEFFYMLKGMYLPILSVLKTDIPPLDCIHSVSTGYAGLLSARIEHEQGIPFVLTEHGIYTREREEEILVSDWIPAVFKKRWMSFFHHIAHIAYDHADRIISLFEKNSHIQKMNGADPGKLDIIPNGVYLPDRLEREDSKKEVFHIGSVIRVVPIKDVKTMMYAAKELKERGLRFTWSILGPMEEDDRYAKECLELQKHLKLEEEVSFVGKVSVKDYYPLFDVMVLSSLSEGQPLSILEAFSYRVPCIATNVGACQELINGSSNDQTGKAGFVVSPTASLELADRLVWMAEHEKERKEMGEIGFKRVEEHYQQEDVLAAYRSIYHSGGKHAWRE
ncbi:GT4 family glycosyltransferase PelF [Bacillus sp. RO3]|nr:GT4 family glycosyltransferase PelF [Bacillus sp. RO3]